MKHAAGFLAAFAAALFFSAGMAAATAASAVNGRENDDQSLAAIITGVDEVVCTATVIGPRQVLTAAACMIDPETGAPFADRQVMPRLDLDDDYIPAGRSPVTRVYLPVADAPFGPKDQLERQLAVVEVGEWAETSFSEVTTETGFHYGHAGDDEALRMRFYDAAAGSPMETNGCAALAIEAGDLMPLNCALPEGAKGAAIRSASGIAGIYLGPESGRYISKAEAEDIGRIVGGLQPRYFRALEAGSTPAITFVLANSCNQPISYSARYRPIGAARDLPFATVSGDIGAGRSRILPLKTENGVVYLHGESADGALSWGGDHRFDGEGYFKITISDWGDYFHALSCGE